MKRGCLPSYQGQARPHACGKSRRTAAGRHKSRTVHQTALLYRSRLAPANEMPTFESRSKRKTQLSLETTEYTTCTATNQPPHHLTMPTHTIAHAAKARALFNHDSYHLSFVTLHAPRRLASPSITSTLVYGQTTSTQITPASSPPGSGRLAPPAPAPAEIPACGAREGVAEQHAPVLLPSPLPPLPPPSPAPAHKTEKDSVGCSLSRGSCHRERKWRAMGKPKR